MKQAVLYPFDKITMGIIRFRELLDFKINCVVDFTKYDECDAVKLAIGEKSDIKITKDIKKGLKDSEILILNDAGAPVQVPAAIKFYEENRLQEKWKDLVKTAHEKGMKILSTHTILDVGLKKWLEEEEINVEIGKQITNEEAKNRVEKNENYTFKNKLKKIGIYGTNSCVGKFTTQMELLRSLSKKSKTKAIITEPTAFLFNQPQFVNIQSDELLAGEYMGAMLKEMEQDDVEYVINSGQSGLSFILNRSAGWINYNIMRLTSFNPDKVIIVCGLDDDKDVRDVIDFLEITLGISKPIAIMIADKKENKGVFERIEKEKLEQRKKELREKFGVKNVEIIKDIEKIIPEILN
ncbi:DUF1611 domain-containing protein [Haliovirga abyssi]|uniref:D-glutamate N-acetyltransferase-like C-terminal domain-containing protein n=1 Tax=Haliovirga abyssi TaxID=2996794 RepID=A0AAU9D879_9FUSO|nr:DUF1611 domain-containing protein [Haliovirga abyssi]BDU49450.1 hypothetical protein HLVA_00190 [Haliovirga abyssi]